MLLLKWILIVFYRPAFFLLLIPILDLLGIVYFSNGAFGFLLPLVTTVLTGLLGLFLARRQGRRYWKELNTCLDRGETPTQPVMNGVLVLLGGLLLLMPGPVTDLIGLLLLFPPLRTLVIVHCRLRFESYRAQGRWQSPPSKPDIIDVD